MRYGPITVVPHRDKANPFRRPSILFRPPGPPTRELGGAAGYRPRVRSAYYERVYVHSSRGNGVEDKPVGPANQLVPRDAGKRNAIKLSAPEARTTCLGRWRGGARMTIVSPVAGQRVSCEARKGRIARTRQVECHGRAVHDPVRTAREEEMKTPRPNWRGVTVRFERFRSRP